MNFTTKAGMVRVDFFKESGKWYATEEMDMSGCWTKENNTIHDACIKCLRENFLMSFSNMTAVILEPYHEFSHPIMLHKWNEQKLDAEREIPKI